VRRASHVSHLESLLEYLCKEGQPELRGMANPQLHPIEVNPRTGEPFLRLNHHKNIILTPHRPSDITCYAPILNDPQVHEWLAGPPIPYLPGNLNFFLLRRLIATGFPQNMLELGLDPFRGTPMLFSVNWRRRKTPKTRLLWMSVQ